MKFSEFFVAQVLPILSSSSSPLAQAFARILAGQRQGGKI